MFSAYLTQVFAPIITFAVFVFVSHKKGDDMALSTARVYTSLSIFALLTDPITSLVMALSAFVASIGCFSRIQAFLDKDVLVDQRTLLSLHESSEEEIVKPNHTAASEKSSTTTNGICLPGKELHEAEKLAKDQEHSPKLSIMVFNADFGWDHNKAPLLKSITMCVPENKITMIIGPVGCGKSTLLKSILGEIPCIQGSVYVSTNRVAFCDQTAWHMNDTIQNSIIASSPFDEQWYHTVLHACALEQDLRQLPRGDQTRIGSKGVALSTGQSQRVVSALGRNSQSGALG